MGSDRPRMAVSLSGATRVRVLNGIILVLAMTSAHELELRRLELVLIYLES